MLQYILECGDLKLKNLIKQQNIGLAQKKSEICTIPTLKLIKMMLKCKVAKSFSIGMLHFNLRTLILTLFVLFFHGLKRRGAWHNALFSFFATGCAGKVDIQILYLNY